MTRNPVRRRSRRPRGCSSGERIRRRRSGRVSGNAPAAARLERTRRRRPQRRSVDVFASGTSFSAPEVAGVAALVFGANPLLHAARVADIIKKSASGHGQWSPAMGYGIVDAAAAVTRAAGTSVLKLVGERLGGKITLRWFSAGAETYRVGVRRDKGRTHVVLSMTTRTSKTFVVRRGHRYVFTVTAFAANGAETAKASYTARG